MAKKAIKIRAKLKNDIVTLKALMTHPMETGNRKDKKSGEAIPAHFIQEVSCKMGGTEIVNALWSGGISKNPYISCKFKGAKKGDELTLSWVDNMGKSESATAKIG